MVTQVVLRPDPSAMPRPHELEADCPHCGEPFAFAPSADARLVDTASSSPLLGERSRVACKVLALAPTAEVGVRIIVIGAVLTTRSIPISTDPRLLVDCARLTLMLFASAVVVANTRSREGYCRRRIRVWVALACLYALFVGGPVLEYVALRVP